MDKSQHIHAIGRRSFLRLLSIAGMGGLALPKRSVSASLMTNSRVIIVTDSHATSGGTINSAAVQVMANSGIRSLAQINDVGEAWKSLLPGINAGSKIAIKVNCLDSSCPTHPPVANAVVQSLKQMIFGGVSFSENNIVLYDRTQWELQGSGYTINAGTSGVRCLATDLPGIGYSSQTYNVNGSSQQLSRIVTEMCDYLINIAVLKNHGDGGVTLCLKNHYGTCSSPGDLHGGDCDPYIPALNDLAPIRAKQKVTIIDALFGIKSGGPGGPPQFAANKLIMSTDIVATDYWGRRILQDNGCTTTAQGHHIDTAATTYGLGTNDPAQMDVINISNPTGEEEKGDVTPAGFELYQNYPNPFNTQTQIRFKIPQSGSATVDVFDEVGRKVATLLNGPLSAGGHSVFFDATNLPSGVYIYQLTTPATVLGKKLMLIK
jgi:uncharacterized protein (DUF362 family)